MTLNNSKICLSNLHFIRIMYSKFNLDDLKTVEVTYKCTKLETQTFSIWTYKNYNKMGRTLELLGQAAI